MLRGQDEVNVEKTSDSNEAIGLNLKRAPSAGTVVTCSNNEMWERSQSDVNLSIYKYINANDSAPVTNVSDNARVYWDLSCPEEQGDVSRVLMNTSATGGFQLALETIHQHDEIFDVGLGTSEDDASSSCSSLGSPSGTLGQLPGCQGGAQSSDSRRQLSYTELASHLPARERVSFQSETRKSCSAIPTEVTSNDGYHGSGVGRKVPLVPPPPLTEVVGGSSNYFCESDFDDSREQIPNYQSRLTALQGEMVGLICYLGVAVAREFEWPGEEEVEEKTEILSRCGQMLQQAWQTPNVGRDLATALCDLIRQQGLLGYLTACMSRAGEVVTASEEAPSPLIVSRRRFVLVAAGIFSQILTCDNLDSILGMSSGNSTPKKEDSGRSLPLEAAFKPTSLFKEVVRQSWLVKTDQELNREFIAILEGMLKHHEKTNRLVVQSGGLKSLIFSCRSTDNLTLRHVAFALVNLGLFGDSDVQMTMVHHNVADWLFPLAFNQDDIIKYYACLAIVVLSAHKELTQIVHSSGTLELVFSFIRTHSPYHFAEVEPSHFQGRSSTWLQRLLPLLSSDNVEAVSLASFHFVMEARIKQRQGKTEIFKNISAIDVLRKSASSIHKVPAQFSRQALKILGVSPPYSLCHPVPIWTVEDVLNWLRHIGFDSLCSRFLTLGIDGDLLLTISDAIMENDLDLKNGIIRIRLRREINKLKMSTSYETCDPSGVCDWLKCQVGPDYCKYTYALIKAGIDRKFLVDITNEMLENDCLIKNSVHRTKILKAIEACKQKFQRDSQSTSSGPPRTLPLSVESCVLSNHAESSPFPDAPAVTKNIDVFISYRRSSGAQLASLIMVHLRLRGYRVFLDIERLPAGRFNENLLRSIQRSRTFLLVLTAHSLDRCADDQEGRDWVHREVVCALESGCTIVPVTDRLFRFPDESRLPADMRALLGYNAISWVHDYQDACVDKIEQFVRPRRDADTLCPFSPPRGRQASPSPSTGTRLRVPAGPDLLDDLLGC